MSKSTSRVGLSEYTARRLAELRARRAEADDTGNFSATSASDSNTTNGNTTTHISTNSSPPLQQPTANRPSLITNGNSQIPESVSSSTSSLASDSGPSRSNDNFRTATDSTDERAAAPRSVNTLTSSFGRSTGMASNAEGARPATNRDAPKLSAAAALPTRGASNGIPGPVVDSDKYKSSSLFDGSCSPVAVRATLGNIYNTGETSAQSSSSSLSTASKKADVTIGFSNLPEQLHRKAVKKGFDFTIMVVGESGLGKSTLISNLFCKYDLYKDRKLPEPARTQTMEIEKRYLEIEDHGIKLRLTVVDTPGFGDTINSSHCLQPIAEYIQTQFEQFFRDETGLNRHNIKDTRVHCCLYFISPVGRGLRQIDIQLMRYLQNIVNVVPVIAKADTLTADEMKRFKAQVLSEIKKHNLRIYQLPPCDDDEDEEFRTRDRDMKEAWPFAVIGANALVEVNGRRVRGRVYPWGMIEADNPTHSDFLKLQHFLISSHLHDLKEVTCDVHYENFRVHRIQQQGAPQPGANGQVDDETERLLRQKEEEIHRMQEMMRAMQSQMMTSRGQQAAS